MSPEIKVLLAAMTPLVELKFAIPLGIKLGLSSVTTFIFATTGTLLPTAIGLAIVDPFSKWLMKHFNFFDKYLTKIFNKTRTDHSKNFDRYGAIFILAFVAIPLPGSGAAMGAMIAFIFGVDYWKAMFLCIVGTAIAATLLLAGVSSGTHLFHLIFQ